MCQVQSPRSFRTEWEPSDRPTGWLGRQSRSPRSTMSPSPARKWRRQGRLFLGLQFSTVWDLLLPPPPREQWHRSRPFMLGLAGEPTTDPIPTAARSLASLLRLPQPDNVDGSQVGARLADFAPHWWSLLGNCRATSIVEDRVGIAFQQQPQLTHQCISFQTRNSGQDLQQAVVALLLKGAIERVTNVTSLLQPVVPGPKEDRRSATCDRSLHSQPPHGSSTLQDGDARVGPFCHQKSGVDGIGRHTRCLLYVLMQNPSASIYVSWSTRKCTSSLVCPSGWRLLHESSPSCCGLS